MIKNFADDGTEDIYHGHFNSKAARKIPNQIHRQASMLLHLMDASLSLEDFKSPPGNRLKELSGLRKGTWSVRINDQWRITFKFNHGEYSDVLIEDYH